VTIMYKIDAVDAMLKDVGITAPPFGTIARRLRETNERRVIFAHASVRRDGQREEWLFDRYRDGKVRTQAVSVDQLDAWLEEQERLYYDLLGLLQAIRQARVGTVDYNAVSPDGQETW
jgi:hypothetical protein